MMELIRISNRKIKIMLTPSDMEHFELRADTFGEDSAEMHRAFRLLLDEIRKETDFDADDKRISVQYFPSKEGGCEMFISHLSAPASEHESKDVLLPTYPKTLSLQREPTERKFHRECAYSFGALSPLLQACKRLSRLPYITSNSAYVDRNGTYFLFLSFLSSSPFTTPEDLNFMVEYGSIENPSMLKIYLSENGRVICEENAVHQLGELI